MSLKKILLLVVLTISSCSLFADVAVKEYTRQDGTHIVPETQHSETEHQETQNKNNPLHNRENTWSNQGNINPYNAKGQMRNQDK